MNSTYHYLSPVTSAIPPELAKIPRWVTWKPIQDGPGTKPRKVPFRADLLNVAASSTDPDTWCHFEQAVTAYEEEDSELAGIGFVLNGDDISGVDIDNCCDAETGEINPEAMRLLDDMQAAYVEFSPSGKGLRAFGYAKPLERGRKGKLNGLDVEFYSNGRYLTLTGRALKRGALRPLNGFHEQAAKLDTGKKKDPTTGNLVDVPADERIAELLQRIRAGDVYHDSLRDLAATWSATGMGAGAIVNALRALMRASDAPKDDRWEARMKDIPRLVSTACDKFAPPTSVAAKSFRLLTADEVAALPPIRWRVKGVIPASGLAAIYGPSGSGKSFLTLDMLAAIADGREWHGHRCIAAPVVYVCLEGEAGLAQRLQALRSRFGDDIGASMRFVTAPFQLLDSDSVTELADVIIEAGGMGAVVVLDTLNRATPGADENSSQDMGLAVAASKALQAMLGGLVILVHHTGKDATRGMRGHTSLFAALDAVVEVVRDGDSRTWRVGKSKDGADGAEHAFRLDVVPLGDDEDGDPVSSCVVVQCDQQAQKAKRLTAAQRAGLSSLSDACNEQGQFDEDTLTYGTHIEHWREVFYQQSTGDNAEAKKKAFQRVRTALVQIGLVTVKDDVYYPTDIGIQSSIALMKRYRDNGTNRDIVGTCPTSDVV
jgi:hypothetical protein